MNRLLILLDMIFVLLYVGALLAIRALGRLPHSIPVLDLILIGLATARITDVVSTDQIMKWLREPFVAIAPEEVSGQQVETREGRGRGFKKVIGDLLACPWCVGVWVAAGLTYVYFLVPRFAWLFILVMAIAELGAIVQTISTILVRLEKYFKGLGVPGEGL